MLAVSGGWCESPGSVRCPLTWVLLVLSSVTYYLVEARMQRVGRGLSRRLDARFGPDRLMPAGPSGS
jgi:hypothetical protein